MKLGKITVLALILTFITLISSSVALDLNLSSPLNSTTYATSPRLVITANENANYSIILNEITYFAQGQFINASLNTSEGVNHLAVNATWQNESNYLETQFTVVDLTPPSAPKLNLSMNLTSIKLNWNSSRDSNGVYKYLIYKNEENTANTTNALTYSEENSDFSSQTQTYKVKAQDNSGLQSESNSVSATVNSSEVLAMQVNDLIYPANYTFTASISNNAQNASIVSLNLNELELQMTQSNLNFEKRVSNLKAGTYLYAVKAMFANNSFLQSQVKSFTVAKTPIQINLSFNNAENSISVEQGTLIEVKVSANTNYPVQVNMQKNGSSRLVYLPFSEFIETTNITVTSFNFTASFLGDENYTSSSITRQVAVNQDTTKPVFLDFEQLTTASSTAVLKWTTSEPSNTQVDFGVTADTKQLYLNSEFTTVHSVTLKELEQATQYYFKITACDKKNNCAVLGPKVFNTLAIQTTQVQLPIREVQSQTPLQTSTEPIAVQLSVNFQKTFDIDVIKENGEIATVQVLKKVETNENTTTITFEIEPQSELLTEVEFKVPNEAPNAINATPKPLKVTIADVTWLLNLMDKNTLSYTFEGLVDELFSSGKKPKVTMKTTQKQAGLLSGFATGNISINQERVFLAGVLVIFLITIIAIAKLKSKSKLLFLKRKQTERKTHSGKSLAKLKELVLGKQR